MDWHEDWNDKLFASDDGDEQTSEDPDDDPFQDLRNVGYLIGGATVVIGLTASVLAGSGNSETKERSSSKPVETSTSGARATESTAAFKIGFRFKSIGQEFEVVDISKKTGRYLVLCLDESAEKAVPISVSEQQMRGEYEVIESGAKQYYCNKETGEVFERIGKTLLQSVSNMELMTAETILLETQFGKFAGTRKSGDLPPGRTDFPFQNAVAEGKVNGHDVKVTTDGAYRRIYNVDGKAFHFSGNAWFSSGLLPGAGARRADTKVHVLALNPQDLARVQAELIPELFRATQPGGALYGKIVSFKTHDLMYGLQEGWQAHVPWNQDRRKQKEPFMPGPQGQKAKGFTIYPVDAVAAAQVQHYIDNFLKDKRLVLEGKVDTGNVGDRSLNPSGSNRTSLERDTFMVGYRGNYSGALIDEQTNRALRDYAAKKMSEKAPGWESFNEIADLYRGEPGQGRLTDKVLSQIMRDCKIDGTSCWLTYAEPEPGQAGRRLMLVGADVMFQPDGGMYLSESEAIKKPQYDNSGKLLQGLTGRPAMYEIARVLSAELGCDLDPARLEVKSQAEKATRDAIKLTEAQRQGLQAANEMLRNQLSGLRLTSREQVVQLLKDVGEESVSQKWSKAQWSEYESLIEKYQKGEAAATRAVNDTLAVRLPTEHEQTKVASLDKNSPETREVISLKQLRHEHESLNQRHANMRSKLIERGQIRETLKAAGFAAETSERLERSLLSANETERKLAKEKIARHFAERGGIRGFAKEVRGRMGAAVMVTAAILPLIFGDSQQSEDSEAAGWSR